MWKGIYDSFLQSMTISWGKFISQYKSAGTAVKNNFQNQIYPEIGLYLIFITFFSLLLFYYYLNNRFGRYYSFKSWAVALLCNSILVSLVTYFRAKSMLGHTVVNVSKHTIWISIINAVYAALLFFILSLILKIKSPMGKRTPF